MFRSESWKEGGASKLTNAMLAAAMFVTGAVLYEKWPVLEAEYYAKQAERKGHPPSAAQGSTLKSFDQFRSVTPIRESLAQELKSSVLHVRTDSTSCSGSIINGYLVTASHCVPDGIKQLKIQTAQKARKAATDAQLELLTKTTQSPELLLGKLAGSSEVLPKWEVPAFASDTPQPGQRFAAATLPGNRRDPMVGNLTYLREDERGRWVFATDPEMPQDVKDQLCSPGASGSLIADGRGGFGVLTSAGMKHLKDNPDKEDWDYHAGFNSHLLNVDLSQVGNLCFATPLTNERFRRHTEHLEK